MAEAIYDQTVDVRTGRIGVPARNHFGICSHVGEARITDGAPRITGRNPRITGRATAITRYRGDDESRDESPEHDGILLPERDAAQQGFAGRARVGDNVSPWWVGCGGWQFSRRSCLPPRLAKI